MKKIGLVVCVLLLVSSISFSLDISLGAKGALGYSTFLGSDWKDYMDPWVRAGFLGVGAGGFVTLGFSDTFAVEPEIMFLRLGGADKESGTGKELFVSKYFAAAALLRLQLPQIYLLAGPMGLLKVGPGEYVIKPESGSDITVEFPDDELSRFLLAATIGIGYQYPIGPGSLRGELRGIYAFSKWYNQELYTDNWTVFALMLMVGYSFSFQR